MDHRDTWKTCNHLRRHHDHGDGPLDGRGSLVGLSPCPRKINICLDLEESTGGDLVGHESPWNLCDNHENLLDSDYHLY